MDVAAERVEHKDQQAFPQNEGCGMARGFFYARPQPAAAF
jgi:EAL domain-containing protein (putative c-di-GMP-specific phosphodiesterase class I)